jgi:hypothetical protein
MTIRRAPAACTVHRVQFNAGQAAAGGVHFHRGRPDAGRDDLLGGPGWWIAAWGTTIVASTGAGLMSANWAGLAALVLLTLAVLIWRIKVEQAALLATLDGSYSSYAARHKRLVPLVW